MTSLCVLRLSAIGDVCNAVAAIQAIQRQQPAISITWVIGKVEHALLKGLPGVEFIVFDKSQGKQAFRDFKASMQERSFDVLLHMQVALRASRVARLIPAKRKIGFDWGRAKELHSLFINERVKTRPEAHVLEGFFDFAAALGVTESADTATWNIPIADDDQAFAEQQIPTKQRTLIISPAASKAERNWLPERYAALSDYAQNLGFVVVLCGGPGSLDKTTGEAIEKHAKQPLKNLIGKSSLKQMLALLGRATLVLAPDTGPAHMAVTQGTPVLGLYGHSNPARTGPYPYQNYVVEVYHTFIQIQQGKSASKLPWGKRVKGQDIMSAITVDAVKAQFDRIVQDLDL